ncbi:hypothetical protein S7711_11223 [Stachybotrys chartarum IBT 7711]|uniref:Uncharacterized protein n=1 Tax=Stachybotrys chartarum (strain CBS 109288 / IBT 7711) TaxID=1280523 RepID=A0A084ANK6_STACB|nr:hypothetical protein S7711_11223 [Stachybotrys chartarum IBT 7711]
MGTLVQLPASMNLGPGPSASGFSQL